jgi:beta-glucosidase
MPARPDFPPDFLFGCSTASYQVEGAAQIGGRGPSVWDTFSHTPGRVLQDHNGDIGVDQYHRYKEDVQLMKWLGLNAYRFSISWSRVLPEGTGRLNKEGLDYYDRLIDELLANGITPWISLFHWDLPQALQDSYGGFQSRRIVDDFAEYAELVAKRYSDRVSHFTTLNEFFCFIDRGYDFGDVPLEAFPPGLKLPAKQVNQARHHALLAHGKAVEVLRAHARQPLKIGISENPQFTVPLIEREDDIAAARKAFREMNASMMTAIMEGRYLDTLLEAQGADAPDFTDADMRLIGAPLDFVGVNIYTPTLVRAAENQAGWEVVPYSASHPRMHVHWLHLGPQAPYWPPRFAKELWNVDNLYIMENGCPSDDQPTLKGEILDTDRVMYLRAHLQAAARAVAEGWPLRGYFIWSLLDNFEWAFGYTKRFGITYVNYSTRDRTPKLSAHWYRDVIRERRTL